MIDETLRGGYMTAVARTARATYQSALGAVLLIEGAVALALIFSPLGVARLMGASYETGTEWPRIAGFLLLALVGHMLISRAMPSAAKLLNILGFVTRAVFGTVLVALGGAFLLFGLFWLAAAITLAVLYFKYFQVEVMNRP